MNVVITVIVPTIGRRNELVTPTSEPPFAATRASSPPEEDKPKPVLKAVTMLRPWDLDARNTVKNFADMEIPTKTNAGNMNAGSNVIFINAPTDTKNNAANISLIGVASTFVTECTF